MELWKSFSMTYKYIGTVEELPVTSDVGDVCYKDEQMYIFTEIDWQVLGNLYEVVDRKLIAVYADNCPNCGSSRFENHVCIYCDSLQPIIDFKYNF